MGPWTHGTLGPMGPLDPWAPENEINIRRSWAAPGGAWGDGDAVLHFARDSERGLLLFARVDELATNFLHIARSQRTCWHLPVILKDQRTYWHWPSFCKKPRLGSARFATARPVPAGGPGGSPEVSHGAQGGPRVSHGTKMLSIFDVHYMRKAVLGHFACMLMYLDGFWIRKSVFKQFVDLFSWY